MLARPRGVEDGVNLQNPEEKRDQEAMENFEFQYFPSRDRFVYLWVCDHILRSRGRALLRSWRMLELFRGQLTMTDHENRLLTGSIGIEFKAASSTRREGRGEMLGALMFVDDC